MNDIECAESSWFLGELGSLVSWRSLFILLFRFSQPSSSSMVLKKLRHIYSKQDRSPNIWPFRLAVIALAIVRVHCYLDELVYSLTTMVFFYHCQQSLTDISSC